jgi:hypothetical protein
VISVALKIDDNGKHESPGCRVAGGLAPDRASRVMPACGEEFQRHEGPGGQGLKLFRQVHASLLLSPGIAGAVDARHPSQTTGQRRYFHGICFGK